MAEGEYRTFVKLDRHELKILQRFQKWEEACTGKKPHRSTVIRGVIRDYWSLVLTLSANSDAELRRKLLENVTSSLEFLTNIEKLGIRRESS